MTINASGAPTGPGAGGSSWGQKIRGTGEVVHGIGESVRGQFFNAIDTATNAGPGSTDLTERGRLEAEQGMSRVTGNQYGPDLGVGVAPRAVPTREGPAAGVGVGEEMTPETARSGITPESGIARGAGQYERGDVVKRPGAPAGRQDVNSAGAQQSDVVTDVTSTVPGGRNAPGPDHYQ